MTAPRRLAWSSAIAVAVALGACAGTASAAHVGDVVVVNADASGSPNFQPQLTLVPFDGSPATALTQFGELTGADDVVMLDPKTALVGGFGTLDRVVIASGHATPIAVNTPLTAVAGIALDGLGRILIADDGPTDGTNADGRVLRVDPSTGVVTVLSSGNNLENPVSIAVTPNGQIYVVDTEGGSSGKLIGINPSTGAQTVDPSTNFGLPTGITALADGDLLVTDEEYGGYPGALVTVDPQTDAESPLAISSLVGDKPQGIRRATVDASGNIFVSAEQPTVDRVDPSVSPPTSTQLSTTGLVDPLGMSVIPSTETLAPTCSVASVTRAGPGGHDQQVVDVRDLGSGLASISNMSINNGTIAVQTFIQGTASRVKVTATKGTQGQPTTWSFDATDVDGNLRHCV